MTKGCSATTSDSKPTASACTANARIHSGSAQTPAPTGGSTAILTDGMVPPGLAQTICARRIGDRGRVDEGSDGRGAESSRVARGEGVDYSGSVPAYPQRADPGL